MSVFNYFQPTELRFGPGRIDEAAETASRFGTRCLLVTVPETEAFAPLYARVRENLEGAGIAVAHFDGVIPNPTVASITAGAKAALEHEADVVLGLGGGSSMDSAKAIAVEATHEGISWDYLFYRDTQPTPATLPIVAATTTSGTGSQVTQVAVITHPEARDKSAIYHSEVFPRVAIIDPELMLTVPEHVTASTGFDVFCHAFESAIHTGTSPYVEVMAWEAIRLVVENLPLVLQDGSDIRSRTVMAWADTLAGLCIANAGVTLPHGIGMAIGGMYPHVMHGEALALNYPAFMRFTWESAVSEFAQVGRLLDPSLEGAPDEEAAEGSCEALDRFLKSIGMWMSLEDTGVPEEELGALAEQSMVLPDYKNNPRVVDGVEMLNLLKQCYTR